MRQAPLGRLQTTPAVCNCSGRKKTISPVVCTSAHSDLAASFVCTSESQTTPVVCGEFSGPPEKCRQCGRAPCEGPWVWSCERRRIETLHPARSRFNPFSLSLFSQTAKTPCCQPQTQSRRYCQSVYRLRSSTRVLHPVLRSRLRMWNLMVLSLTTSSSAASTLV